VVVAGDAGLRVFYGGVAGVIATSDFVDPARCTLPAGSAVTRRVANLGDLNGDGGDEVGLAYIGVCAIVLRAPIGAAASAPALAEQRTLLAAAGDAMYASTLAGVGDYDDDGLGDFAVAIPSLSDPSRSSVKIYFGDPVAWAQGMSVDGGVAPGALVINQSVAGWGYSVAALGWGDPRRRFARALLPPI
jgi:hypothetical protein